MKSNSLMNLAFEDNLVRVQLDEYGNPWFCVKDVCRVLELENVTEATRHLDDDEKGSFRITEGTSPEGGNPNMLFVSESGLYALVFRSRKPEAKRLRKWVTAEVLPSIRKTGAYAMPGSGPAIPKRDGADGLLSDAARRLPSRVKAMLMNNAVQMVRHTDAPHKLDEMYAGLCNMVAGNSPAPTDTPRSHDRAAVKAFVEECCEQGGNPRQRVALNTVYNAYRDWCEDQDGGLESVPRGTFIRFLPLAAPFAGVTRPRVNGERMWFVNNLRLKKGCLYAYS